MDVCFQQIRVIESEQRNRMGRDRRPTISNKISNPIHLLNGYIHSFCNRKSNKGKGWV